LIAERGDLAQLRVIEAIINQDSPRLVKELMARFDWNRHSTSTNPPEISPDESDSKKAPGNFDEEKAKLSR